MPSLLRFLCVALGLTLPLLAEAEKPFVPARTPAELEQRLVKIMKDRHVPGLGVVLASRQGTIWEQGLGLAEVAAGRPATAATLFRIGSISKTFVGLAALKLVEEGRLNLNTPVRTLVPEVAFQNRWEATDPVRVVHLLAHTTGWADAHFKEYAFNDPTPATLAQGLAVGPESRTCRWRPGTRYAYCNAGPAVAAAIIEKVTGKPYETYIQETFFTPIGMPTADYFPSPRALTLLTNLYHDDGRTPYPYWHEGLRPIGAINVSAHEMGAYLRFLLNRGEANGTRILAEASLQRMETPTASLASQGGIRIGSGLTSFTSPDDHGFIWQGHTGGLEGALSALSYLPEAGLGYFFAINTGDGDAFDDIRKEVKGFLTKDLPAPVLPPAVHVPASVARTYTGWYREVSSRNDFDAFLTQLSFGHFSFQGDSLIIRPWLGPKDTFPSVDGLRFREKKKIAAHLMFQETPEGLMATGSDQTFARIGAPQAWTAIVLLYLVLATLVTVPLFALVWGCRWLFRRMKGVPNLHVRVWPLLTELVLAGTIAIPILGGSDAIQRFGNRTLWSMGLTAGTCLFALFSLIGLWAALRGRRPGMNRWAYLHSLVASVTFVIVTVYLAYWGVIGYRSWA